MTSSSIDIYNNNLNNFSSQENYDIFNNFIFSNDIKILGKLLHRFDFFSRTKHLPGDIVEIGVFKGSGVASFLKFLDIYCHNSIKKIIGFDIFDPENSNIVLQKDNENDKQKMQDVYNRVNVLDRTLENVSFKLKNINDNFILIEGDVEQTLPKFTSENPGFRISLLYIDVDIERPTYNSLKYLWDRVVPGGIIVFDEYEYHKFSESSGVDRFMKERNIILNLISTNWMSPTCYVIK
jgi:hypothetical protein